MVGERTHASVGNACKTPCALHTMCTRHARALQVQHANAALTVGQDFVSLCGKGKHVGRLIRRIGFRVVLERQAPVAVWGKVRTRSGCAGCLHFEARCPLRQAWVFAPAARPRSFCRQPRSPPACCGTVGSDSRFLDLYVIRVPAGRVQSAKVQHGLGSRDLRSRACCRSAPCAVRRRHRRCAATGAAVAMPPNIPWYP